MQRAIVVVASLLSVTVLAHAESPQIALGFNVSMQVAAQYDQRRQAGTENPLYFGSAPSSSPTDKALTFTDHTELLAYFQSLPIDRQEKGLWVKRFARTLWTQPDTDRVAVLIHSAELRNLPLFICEPKSGKGGSWLVSWDCDKLSPSHSKVSVVCEAKESKAQAPQWECKAKTAQ